MKLLGEEPPTLRQDEPIGKKPAVGAPAYGIEVTAEMISAGGETLWRRLYHDPLLSPGLADDLAEDVLRAALQCAPNRS